MLNLAWRLLSVAIRLRGLIQKELKSKVRVPLAKRLLAWRHGFLSESQVIYGLDKENVGDYLSDFARHIKTRNMNGKFMPLLDNKLIFAKMFDNDLLPTPRVLFWLDGGEIFSLRGNRVAVAAPSDVVRLCRDNVRLVIKPVDGGGGASVFRLEAEHDRLFVNRGEKTASDLESFLKSRSQSIAVEFVQQHGYAEQIFPLSTNSLRIVTMWDYRKGCPFIAAAVHRFGRNQTIPVDNWTQGGLSVSVDLDRGCLGKGIMHPSTGVPGWHSAHPDTGEQIEGIVVPGWERICTQLLQAASTVPFLPYIGWDIVVTDVGFTVLEGNNYSDVNLIQVHGPLLRDPRIETFFRHHRVI
ncbi:MAG: hypothetical protein GEU87_14600 [Alphaproteobacteria bacterium]|nr:hypothetical protein [Alphaproteobacteria bacterium]